MRKIGIMGGTFNPIHMGHLIIAQAALISLKLDKVWFMPAGDPPHKDNSILDKKHRLRMVEAAIKDNPDFELFTYETDKERPSYSAVTMTELDELYPDCEFYFIMGTDSFLKFEKWYKPEIICAHTSLVVTNRNNVGIDELMAQKAKYERTYNARVEFVNTPQIEISSSNIREDVKNDISLIRYKLPDEVYNYILTNHLYR